MKCFLNYKSVKSIGGFRSSFVYLGQYITTSLIVSLRMNQTWVLLDSVQVHLIFLSKLVLFVLSKCELYHLFHASDTIVYVQMVTSEIDGFNNRSLFKVAFFLKEICHVSRHPVVLSIQPACWNTNVLYLVPHWVNCPSSELKKDTDANFTGCISHRYLMQYVSKSCSFRIVVKPKTASDKPL